MTMTLEEWKQKKAADKEIKAYLEKARQQVFRDELSKDLEGEFNSIVDVDSV